MFTPFLMNMATDVQIRLAIFMLKIDVTSVVPIPFTIFLSSADTDIH